MNKEGLKTQKPTEYVVLSNEAYLALERQLPQPVLTKDPIEAATLNGIQIVLKVLRNGFALPRS